MLPHAATGSSRRRRRHSILATTCSCWLRQRRGILGTVGRSSGVWQAPILSCIDSCNVHQFLQRKPPKPLGCGAFPDYDFLCEFYFIIAFFIIALFTIRLKIKDGSVGSFPFQAQVLHSTTAASPAKPRDVAPAAASPATPPPPPPSPEPTHPSQVLLLHGSGLELRQADTPSLSSGR